MTEVQIVNPDGAFVGGLDVSSISAAARNYSIVAVVGCQSGGKSTLLNAAFGTTFPVLDAPRSGRRRTTLGVWAAVAAPPTAAPSPRVGRAPPAVVVLDVEGADSRERGDGAKAFESRTALFALALAGTVVVNMWAHDIGRYSAANYELFETVFAHAAELRKTGRVFTEGRSVRILMVVRDHDGESAMADIRRVLLGDLENIWDALKVEGVDFSALFKFEIVLLPHKIYAPVEFEKAVGKFAERFVEPIAVQQHVPIVGLEALASSVWDSVCATTGGGGAGGDGAEFTLDLPRHAALAAHYSCGEVIVRMLDGEIGGRIDALRHDIEAEWRHPLRDFGAQVAVIVRDALASYDEQAAPYKSVDSKACAHRREELIVALADRLSIVSDRYMATCRDTCMNGFEDEFRSMLGGVQGFARESRRLANVYIKQYKTLVDGARLPSVLQPYLARKAAQARKESQAEEVARNATAIVAVEDGEEEFVTLGEDGAATPETAPAPVPITVSDSDNEEDDAELFTVDRFKRNILALVEERKRLGELLLPGGVDGANLVAPGGGPKDMPWWKGLLLRAAVMGVNYLQAAYAHRRAMKVHRQNEEDFPPGPTF